jgi:transposase
MDTRRLLVPKTSRPRLDVMQACRDNNNYKGIEQSIQAELVLQECAWQPSSATADRLVVARNEDMVLYRLGPRGNKMETIGEMDLVDSRKATGKRLLKEDTNKKKASSVEALQAAARNAQIAAFFWSEGPPLGVRGVLRIRLVDVGECGIEITNPKNRGTGLVRRDIQEKLSVLCAIEPGDPTIPPPQDDGSIENPRRWFQINQQAATAFEFADFVHRVCIDMETNPAGDVDKDRVFLWDTKSSHLSPVVIQTVEGRPTRPNNRFRIVRRPPYRSWLSPIEFILGELACELKRRIREDWDLHTLEQEIRNVLGSIGRDGTFNKTFEQCGY